MGRTGEHSNDAFDDEAELVTARALGVSLRPLPGETVPLGPESATPSRFMPRIPTEALRGMIALVRAHQDEALARALRRVAADASAANDQDGKAVRATALLLCDLVRLGWRLEVAQEALWITAPRTQALPGEDVREVKERLRAPLLTARAAQLADPAVRAFFRRMETPRVVDGQQVSVLNMIDDGQALAQELERISRIASEPERADALDDLVSPTLHLATADAACPFTGLPLLDIWRYFRHTWSLEYRPTPGRTLFVLVRNSARPFAPVMGIAALANALPQLRVRDQWIGWTPEVVLKELADEPKKWTELREACLRTLAEARAQIRSSDLLARCGRRKGEQLEETLLAIASAAASKREAELKKRQRRISDGLPVVSLRSEPTNSRGTTDWKAASEAPLFVRKRAKTLADILFAERILQLSPMGDRVTAILDRDSFRRAVGIALREIRKVGLASRLLDVNVCGAVAPYGELLAGKLMALALGSSEVRSFYRVRYREQSSEIASKMAGRSIVRTPEVCVLTTTSLYGVAASQYNRLRINVGGRKPGRLEWKELGRTEGYGTVHLSEATVEALRAVSVDIRGGRNVNNVFGEGNSPRLRQVREGVEDLGIDADSILRHSAPRIVYALQLHDQATRALLLNKAPRAKSPDFDAIAQAWSRRWLSMRINNRDVLGRVAQQGVASVRVELAAPEPQLDLFVTNPCKELTSSTVSRRLFMPKQSKVELVQDLYRALSSCADHHEPAIVELLHIETDVDRWVRTRATKGQIVFVTGNPGDGKTHLIRKLEDDLRVAKVDVCLDANEEEDDALIKRIDQALKKKPGMVMAINEGILVELVRKANERSWAYEVRRQLLNPFEYRKEGASQEPRIAVLDLNHRNNLASHVVRAAVQKMIALGAPCSGCPKERCDGAQNTNRLGESVVVDRLVLLLELVAKSGHHATMRDLFGFLSFMLWGNRDCAFVKGQTARFEMYAENAFVGGVGPLFDAVRGFDPALHTAPLLDDKLWRGAEDKSGWLLAGANDANEPSDLDTRKAHFERRKRRAYFEYRDGEQVLKDAGSEVDKALRELADPDRGTASTVVRLLNRFFDRDEEFGNLLHLWVMHRYDARQTRYAAARWHVATTDLELLTPRLRSDLAEAFPEYYPDHVILVHKGDSPDLGLRIDRTLLGALLAAEQGLPSTFRSGEPGARITAFYDRLAKRAAKGPPTRVADVRFVDIDTGANISISVDLTDRKYVRK